eukprot:evm.model.scf_168.10 EVM.evm.TU.scf_168.10   scf_168:72336-75095(+)
MAVGWRLASFLTLLSVFLPAQCQPGAPDVHPLTDMPPEGFVSTKSVLPEHPQKLLPAGDVIPVLLGFRNEGDEAVNVSAIMGSLNSAADFRVHYQNFSMQPLGVTVPPNVELTMEYLFRPDPALPPMEFRVAITAFYSNVAGNEWHSSTFFNETIEIVDPEKLFDTEVLFMYATLICIFALIVFGIVRWAANLSIFKKAAATKKTKAVNTATGDDDWLKGTPASKVMKSRKADKKAD